MAAVDIIIPLYNKQSTIERAIRSVQAQTFTDWRLIIVDDGSTDTSPQIVYQMSRLDPRIQLISQANAGPGAARNTGISAATATYVAFLDADDQWYPQHLQTVLTALQNNQEVAMAGSAYYQWPFQTDIRDEWAKVGISPGTYQIHGNETADFAEAFVILFHVDATAFRTESARRYGGFYEQGCRSGEDMILFAKTILNERFMLIGGNPTARYNRQDSDLTSTYNYALNPMLLDPDILLKYCPAAKLDLARNMLTKLALRTAFYKARNGYKTDALKLVELHPQMKTFGWAWRRCQFAITFSSVLPYWIWLKCRLGPPVRQCFRHLGYRLKLLKPPPSIDVSDSAKDKL